MLRRDPQHLGRVADHRRAASLPGMVRQLPGRVCHAWAVLRTRGRGSKDASAGASGSLDGMSQWGWPWPGIRADGAREEAVGAALKWLGVGGRESSLSPAHGTGRGCAPS